jgi:carbamoyl-phosphate synthase small subunit
MRYPTNFTYRKSISDYLFENKSCYSGIDTRALTKHIRIAGAMKAVIYAGDDFGFL